MILDPMTGQLVTKLEGRIGPPLTFSKDGNQLTAISARKDPKEAVVAVWDTTNGNRIRVLSGHHGANEYCERVVFSPSNDRYAVTIVNAQGEGLRMKVMETQPDKEELLEVLNLAGPRLPLKFSPDGLWLAMVTAGNSVQLVPMTTGQSTPRVTLDVANVSCVAFSPNGKWLVTSGNEKAARIWNVENGVEEFRLTGHTHTVSCVAFSPDGTQLATSSLDNTVKIWQLRFDP